MNVALPPRNDDLRDLQRVRLLAQLTSPEGILYPGEKGTIVYRHRGGEAFEVEFSYPFATVVTLKADEIDRIED